MLEMSNSGRGFGSGMTMRPTPMGGGAMGGPRRMPIGPMMPSFPRSFKKGGKVVRGGVGKLHKGERVISARTKAVLGSKKSKTKKLIEAAGHEMKVNPPKVLAKTAKKSGAKRANKQRIAIMLSKARAAGANIPKG